MRQVVLVALLVASAAAWPNWASDAPADSLEHIQQDVNRLLYYPTEHIPSKYGDLKDRADHFNPVGDVSIYKDGGVAATKLHTEYAQHRVLERHHWFSLFNTRQREEALMFFETLLSCKDYNCFLNNACFYREHLNEGEFVYGLYVAVIHSDITHGVVHPPLYEIMPHMFTNSEIIQKAYSAQMTQTSGHFHMDFTGSQKNPEQRVAYFGEDIGMNTHHVSWHMDYPFWWQDKYGHKLDRKGELFYYIHHQLTARFDAERLSNNLDTVDELQWDKPIIEGFAPHTSYRYGGEFPARPDNIFFADVDGVARVRDMLITESRIRDAIAHGFIEDRDGKHIDIKNEHGIDVLGDIVESSVYSPNPEYYGALHNMAHIMLGRQADPKGKFNMPPGVMEHFETATRDPTFFRLHKYMDNIFREHKESLTPYTEADLNFEGVAVDSVTIDGQLKTFFENYTFDLSMAVDHSEGEVPVVVETDVSRLNHEKFGYKFDVVNNNAESKLATIRVFLCPRYDSNHILLSFDEGRTGCIEVDKYWRTLTTGHNTFTRKSTESSVTVPDRLSYHDLVEKTDAALASGSKLHLEDYERSCGIPERMLLPKGKPEGMEFALAVAVTDGSLDLNVEGMEKDEHGSTHSQCGIHGEKYPDKRPLGFPLDRKIPDDRVFLHTSNIYKTVVKVFHDEHH